MKTAAENRISGPWMQAPGVRAVVDALGVEACRFVGGAVRDTLIDREVSDIDLATPLAPAEVINRLEAAGLKAVPTGIEHGTITAVSGHRAIEITTLRHDVETDGRRADVAFHSDWEADAARRDFTMNAIYAAADGTLYDYFEGAADLAAGRVRFIGDADARIKEDALRILRFFRFHAWYGQGEPDKAGLEACGRSVGQLSILSRERVRDELLKLLAASDPMPVLGGMEKIGVLDEVLPHKGDPARLARLVAVETRLERPDRLRRLAALLVADVDAAALITSRYRLSNAEAKRLAAMAAPGCEIIPGMTPAGVRAATYWLGSEAVIDCALLSGGIDQAEKIEAILDEVATFECPTLPLAGDDLKALGVDPGPEMGRLLRQLEEAWVASDFTMGREELLSKAQKELKA